MWGYQNLDFLYQNLDILSQTFDIVSQKIRLYIKNFYLRG